MKLLQHFNTITYHKYLVMKGCFCVGLYRQGILHDLSKYSPSEFFVGLRYYQGNRSPNDAERESIGYSSAWMHHKGRNKHHYEYWTDYNPKKEKGVLLPIKMPTKYIVEMFMDRIAACKVYRGRSYTDIAPLEYYNHSKSHLIMHPDSAKLLEHLLQLLAKEGEKKTFQYIKREILHQ